MLLPLTALALSVLPRALAGVTNDHTHAVNQTFDYVIVGGGTSGLTLAARLTEDPDVTVLVIEAGPDNRTSSLVDSVIVFPAASGTALDWASKTVDGRSIGGGKTLGGSSSINGGLWTRAMKSQYDAFTTLLEPEDADKGWNWDGLLPYMKKAEFFSPPNATQRTIGADDVEDAHGLNGSVHAAFPTGMFTGTSQSYFLQTAQNLTGIRHLPDLAAGDANGVSWVPISLNKFDNDARSSAAQAYLTPVEKTRTNWLTLVEHSVTKILFNTSTSANSSLHATGVQFAVTPRTANAAAPAPSALFTAYASREVILSAGALHSPALLQLSGIGDAARLTSLGIKPLVDLPTVGKNLQDQTNNGLFAFGNGENAKGVGPSDMLGFFNLKELFGANATAKAADITNGLDAWAASQAHNGASQAAMRTILGLQADPILNDNAPVFEIDYLSNPGSSGTINAAVWNLLPFSRGNLTITSTNPFTPPTINVNWFDVPFDMDVQVAGARLMRAVLKTAPTSKLVSQELLPGGQVPATATDAQWAKWIKGSFSSNSHPLATAAMMRRELGGVVDAELRVYDTANLRVVDASVLPIQLSAHLSATIYGVAEKAADIIKATYVDAS